MFVDELKLKIIAGAGGMGCTSFRREKYVPMGGPDGGNGGRGSDIIFVTDPNITTLVDLRYLKTIKGDKGENGKGSNMYGKNAIDVTVKVPLGTIIYDAETNLVLCDLTKVGDSFIVCHGGHGGKGNKAFATHDNPAPHFSEKGEPGEERIIRLELEVLADVGLIGEPSVGKSTLLSLISSSKPKIAAYHFTTLSPNLGVVTLKDHSTFVMADLPGLIAGASKGVGLGDVFLKHAMRCKILLHIIDMGAEEGRNPIEDYQTIRKEVLSYSDSLKNKTEILVASKMDIMGSEDNLASFKKAYPDKIIFPISAYNNTGIDELIEYVGKTLKEIPEEKLFKDNEFEDYVLFELKSEKPYTITKDDEGIWVVKSEKLEKLIKMTKFEEEEGVLRFSKKLQKIGLENDLEALGAKPGDDVQIGDYMFTFKS